jgi:hypothetical protein
MVEQIKLTERVLIEMVHCTICLCVMLDGIWSIAAVDEEEMRDDEIKRSRKE